MGAVFLILGGTFVFAPQIVSGVNKFLAAVFRRPRKEAPVQAEPVAETAHLPVVHAFEAPVSDAASHEGASGEWEAAVEGQQVHPGSAVARLRQEIGTSWGPPGNG